MLAMNCSRPCRIRACQKRDPVIEHPGVPRLYAEAGGHAELRHNLRAALAKASVVVVGIALGVSWRRPRARE